MAINPKKEEKRTFRLERSIDSRRSGLRAGWIPIDPVGHIALQVKQ
jgi:hypothetical protein